MKKLAFSLLAILIALLLLDVVNVAVLDVVDVVAVVVVLLLLDVVDVVVATGTKTSCRQQTEALMRYPWLMLLSESVPFFKVRIPCLM
jgi:hypothetical protein